MLKRNIFDDEDAVSEVVGTILILSITVVLFSTIFATVSHLETPDRRTYTEMDAEFTMEDKNISISHQGGKSIDMYDTTFFVIIDGNSSRFTYDMDELQLSNEDDMWDIGEIVEIDISDLVDWKDEDPLEDPVAEILVSDNVNNQIIWSTELSLTAILERPRIRDTGVNYQPEWKNYVEGGEKVEIYASVDHPTEHVSELTVTVDLSSLKNYDGFEEMTYDENIMGNEFRKEINITNDEEERTYHLEVRAEDREGASSRAYINLNVGPREDVREKPDIFVDENKIHFNPTSPTSGESLRVDSVVENDGGSRAIVNLTVWDKKPNGDVETVGIINNIRVAAGGGRDISATWTVNGSGEHNITVDVTDVESPGGDNLRDVEEVKASGTIYVKPSILVVDDDPLGTRESSLIQNALSGADFSYDTYMVGGPEADGPSDERIDRYDLLIWVTGGATEDTLTDKDIENLEDFLEAGNNLWLIGEGVMEDIGNRNNQFVSDYLGIAVFEEDQGAPQQNELNGTGILENLSFPVNQDFASNGDYIEADEEANPMMVDGLAGDNYVGVSYNNSEFRSKVAVNSIQMQSIMSGRSTLAYRITKWLANMEHTSGRDIAVSDQWFSTRTPMYQEEVEVSATLRNNGPVEETVDVRLYVNDRLDTTQRMQVTLEPDGGSEDVTFEWSAQPVGSHDIVIKADPFNRIEENNVWNNDITYTDFDTTINVQYSVLIVDADESEFYTRPNTTSHLVNHIESLGYSYDYYLIEENEERPDSDLMGNYNSVYWSIGNATEDNEGNYPPLTDEDVGHIKSYLGNNTFVSFYLEGHRVIEDIRVRHRDFVINYLGIDPDTTQSVLNPEELHGVNGDPFTHGMDYLIDTEGISDFYSFEVDAGESVITNEDGNTVGSRYENEENDFRTIYSGVGLSHIAGPNVDEGWYEEFAGLDGYDEPVNLTAEAACEEYMYMLTKWFGNEDERVELRIADVDIEPEIENPVLGQSYLLKASIQNVGFTGSSALIRFKDGDSTIASESIFVSGDSFHTAEVSWRPNFAGRKRPIRVVVDPLQNVQEIGNEEEGDRDTMGFNNHAVINQPVYFFWDDMENGDDNWNHEATIANINGEQPLEYLSEEYEEVYTDIEDTWDDEMSLNFNNNNLSDYFSYSDPYSFRFNETKDESEEETSTSSSGVNLNADSSGPELMATSLVENGIFETDYSPWTLSEITADGVAEWDGTTTYPADGTGSIHVQASATDGNTVIEEAQWDQSIGPTSDTLTLNGAYNMEMTTANSNQAPIEGTVEIQVYDTGDGAWNTVYTNTETNTVSTGWVEFGSDATYSPTGEVNEIRAYMSLNADSSNQDSSGDIWMDNISATIPTSLDNDPPVKPFKPSPSDGSTGVSTNPTLEVNVSDPNGDTMTVTFYNASDDSEIGQNTGVNNGTTSVTWSGLEEDSTYSWYAVADDGYLENTSEIWTFRTGEEGEDIIATGPNKNKTAVTPSMNLKNKSSAELTFRSKHKIHQGNGGFVMIGIENDANLNPEWVTEDENGTEWAWKYAIPSESTYNTELKDDVSRVDSFGNEIEYAWSGTSGGGSFGWDHVRVNIMRHVEEGYEGNVRVMLNYTQYGKGTGYGWFFDDVKVTVSRDVEDDSVDGDNYDMWHLDEVLDADEESTTVWKNVDPNTGYFKGGIDNSLVTTSIDLTNAKNVYFGADFKFNINSQSGVPPDGFRVEITTDGGSTWMPLNMGARTSYGISGDDYENSGEHIGNNWISAESLSRLEIDLSDFSGNVVKLRFRVITTNAGGYDHYEEDLTNAGFGGFYVDNVVVGGSSTVEEED